MKKIRALTTMLMTGTVLLWTCPVFGHENVYGGSTSHSYGSTSHTNVYGGSSAHAYGGGTEHTNMYGGSTSGEYGEGAEHTYSGGASAYHPPAYGGYPGYPAYHPPVAVPYYSSGCYGCAAAAGAVAGAAVGVAVGAAAASAQAAPAYPVGSDYATLPAGSTPVSQGGATYYVDGSVWFQPAYGANGVYYVVVPAP